MAGWRSRQNNRRTFSPLSRSRQMKSLKIPSYVTLALSVLAGILAYLNQQTFGFAEPWHTLVTAGLAALATLGIAPAAHGALATALRLPYNVSLMLATAASSAAVGLATVSMDKTLRSVLVAALTAIAGMFGGTDLTSAKNDPTPIPKP